MISGVYAIRTANDRLYIGASSDISRRMMAHLGNLARGKHCNKALQKYITKHGLNGLTFSIIEECAPDHIFEAERRHILTLRSEDYNVTVLKPRVEPIVRLNAGTCVQLRDVFIRKRIELGLSQEMAADKIGIILLVLTGIEDGTAKLNLRMATRLADAYGCTLDELCGRINGGDDATGRGKPGA